MSVRPYKNKPGWWYIDFYPNGKKPDPITGKVVREQIPFKGSEESARSIEMELRQKHRGLTEPVRVNRHISEMFPEFLADYKLEHSGGTCSDILYCSKRILGHFGRYQINSITQALIDSYKSARLDDKVKPRTISKEIAYLRSFINWAVKKNYAQPLPFQIKSFPKKMTTPPLPIVPSQIEIDAMLLKLEPDKRLLARLMYAGGLRRNEACSLTVERVDLQNGLLFVVGKGNKERIVPIADPVLLNELTTQIEKMKKAYAELMTRVAKIKRWNIDPELLDELTTRAEKMKKGYLFPHPKTGEPIKDPRKALKTAAIKAGITKRVYNHLLRHSFGSHMTGKGVGLQTLQVVMGHADLKTTTICTEMVIT